jgi:pimeloyl-ACP methyl ester carboxylesterase
MRSAVLGALVLALAGCGGDDKPAADFGEPRELGDRVTVDTRFESRGARLAGTLSLPSGDGPHPALVWVHGSGPDTRSATAPYFTGLLDGRFAVFAFDKRGAGESEGECCPLDFDLLADDVLAAVDALRSRDEIDDDAIGLLALSQGGWIAPLAASKSKDVKFVVVLSGSAVSVGEEDLYSGLTGDSSMGCTPDNPPAMISRLVMAQKPSRFDPRPVLAKLDVPVLWLYGARDMSQPVEKDLVVLRRLRGAGKQFDVVVFPNASHALTECEGSLVPDLGPRLNAWLRDHVG